MTKIENGVIIAYGKRNDQGFYTGRITIGRDNLPVTRDVRSACLQSLRDDSLWALSKVDGNTFDYEAPRGRYKLLIYDGSRSGVAQAYVARVQIILTSEAEDPKYDRMGETRERFLIMDNVSQKTKNR